MADFLNGSFESGSFSDWSTLGSAVVRQGSVDLGSSSDSNARFAPTNGSYFAELTSQDQSLSSIESFLGLSNGSINASFDTEKDNTYTVGSAIKQTVYVSAGQKLTFDWKFKTTDYWSYNDSSFVVSGPSSVKLASVSSAGDYGAQSGGYEYTFADSGVYIIGIAVFNESDAAANTYLAVDNFKITGSTVNRAPASANRSVRISEDVAYTFSASDFAFSDDDSGDSLKSILITSAPERGQLLFDGSSFTIGSSGYSIAKADLGKLTFVPAANANGDGYSSFQFKVQDQADATSAASTVTIDVTPVNDALVSVRALNFLDQAYETGSSPLGITLDSVDAHGAAGALFAEILELDDDQLLITAVRWIDVSGSQTINQWNEVSTTQATAIEGLYGTLTLASDGSYTYVVNDQHVGFLTLFDGQKLVDHFQLQVSDGHGDPIDQDLNIGINGRDEVAKPIISLVSDDDRVNRVEKGKGVTVTGLAPGASTVGVSWGATTKHISVTNGTWSTLFSNTTDPNQSNPLLAVISEIPDDWQDTTIRITAFDHDGHASLKTERAVLVDTIFPTMPWLSQVAGDDQINASEKQNGITLIGQAEAGASVTLNWATVTKTALATPNGFWSIQLASSEIPDDSPRSTLLFSASDQAGNTSLVSRYRVGIDTVSPQASTLELITSDGIINIKEFGLGVRISGQIERGSALLLAWDNLFLHPSVLPSGRWSQWITAQQLASLDQNAPIIATVIDKAGNSTISPPFHPTFDLLAPKVPLVESVGVNVAGQQVINATTKTAGLLLTGKTGSADAASTIRVLWGRTDKSTVVSSDGSWSIFFNANELPSDTAASLVSVQATDAAGNSSSITTQTILIDTKAPDTPKIITIAGDDLITAAEALAGVIVEGTAEPGASITLSWSSLTRTTATTSGGTWSISFNSSELGLLNQGATSLSVLANDLAGNHSSSVSRNVQLATIAPAVPSLDAVEGDNRINLVEAQDGLTLIGRAEANSQINARLGGRSFSGKADLSGTWSIRIRSSDLPSADGTAVLQISGINASGLESNVLTRALQIDRSAPILLSQTISGNKVLLSFSEDLDSSNLMANSFQVLENRSLVPVMQAKISSTQANLVELTLGRQPASTSTLSTTNSPMSGGRSLSDISGNSVNAFSTVANGFRSTSSVMSLASSYRAVELLGSDPISGVGNALANSITGNDAGNILEGRAGGDTLTGLGGSDIFRYAVLSDSLLNQYDCIADLAIGFDRIDAPHAVTLGNVRQLGSVSALTDVALRQVLSSDNFVANGAASFDFGTRTFLALNDSLAGFSSSRDAVIEITGYSGSLNQLEII